ncbi:SHOCT domain-containing protein [Kribbella sindirgiensis]|uniref:SHOCT domain-containing protein n=2 Tax=Kribbella sindirgiensis TaxID=1124744 RepID=A0A4R0I564_9ACTN|nr:SHOCT domain-containing protein [Kribbella sindirgiensis]
MYWNGMGWGGWVMMTITVVAFWGLVAVVVVALVRSLRGEPARRAPGKSALELLDERFARGEIDETDYHRRRELLLEHRVDH